MTIGDRIKKLRGDKHWSLSNLSFESGVSRQYLWELERYGASNPTIHTLRRIANALGTSVGVLIGEVDEF